MKQSLKTRAEQGAALVLSSHLLPLVEELCHRILILAGGQRLAFGTLEEIRSQLQLENAPGSSLEDVFIQVTSDLGNGGQGGQSGPGGTANGSR